MIGGLLPILLHRIGLIIAFVSSGVLVVLPRVFNKEEDLRFASKLSVVLKNSLRFGFLILVVTGLIRFEIRFHHLFPLIIVKMLAAATTVTWSIIKLPKYPDPMYDRNHLIQFILIFTTSSVGILL